MGSLAINACKLCLLLNFYCRIRYMNDASQNWILYDGGGPDKRSTNGTWIYVDESFRIYDMMVFRACNYLFQVRLQEPEFERYEDTTNNIMFAFSMA